MVRPNTCDRVAHRLAPSKCLFKDGVRRFMNVKEARSSSPWHTLTVSPSEETKQSLQFPSLSDVSFPKATVPLERGAPGSPAHLVYAGGEGPGMPGCHHRCLCQVSTPAWGRGGTHPSRSDLRTGLANQSVLRPGKLSHFWEKVNSHFFLLAKIIS